LDSARGTPETIATESDSRMKSAEKVNFKRIVLKEAKRILSEVEELPLPQKLINQQKEHFEQKMYAYFDLEKTCIFGRIILTTMRRACGRSCTQRTTGKGTY
jgi:hypothetical protein